MPLKKSGVFTIGVKNVLHAIIIFSQSEYIRQMDLGGGMIWALDLDDFRNRCGGGRHPLLSTIRNTLGPAPDGNDILTTPRPFTSSTSTSVKKQKKKKN